MNTLVVQVQVVSVSPNQKSAEISKVIQTNGSQLSHTVQYDSVTSDVSSTINLDHMYTTCDHLEPAMCHFQVYLAL